MQRLCATDNTSKRLNRHTNEIDFGLLSGKANPCCLRMETHQPATRIFRAESLAHLSRPNASCRPHLGNFFKEIVVAIEEEANTWGKIINIKPPRQSPFHIFQAINQRESQ